MTIWQGILLGAVQGLAEFLPISSSGHLILFQRWLGVSEGGLFFDVMLHIATLIPVVVVLFKEIMSLFKKPLNKLWYLIIATIPAGLTGVLLGDVIDEVFYAGDNLAAILLGCMFLLTAVELFVAERVQKKTETGLPLSYKSSIIMGLAQGVAVFPGLSRSGTVISAGCFTKLDREENANFAFLMSVPIILGAALKESIDVVRDGIQVDVLPLIFGMITAMITGYFAITFMLKLIKKANYKWFSLYLVLIAAACIITKLCFGV